MAARFASKVKIGSGHLIVRSGPFLVFREAVRPHRALPYRAHVQNCMRRDLGGGHGLDCRDVLVGVQRLD